MHQRLWNSVLLLLVAASSSASTYHGRLIDQAGKPVIRATVGYYYYQNRKSREHVATTDAQGSFAIEAVYAVSEKVPLYLFVEASDHVLRCIQLTDENQTITLNQKTTPLSVHVHNSKGGNVAGVPVSIAYLFIAQRYSIALPSTISKRLVRTTDLQGLANFEGIPAEAQVGFNVDAPQYALLQWRAPIAITPGTPVEINLERSGTLVGRVFSADGKPLKNIEVYGASQGGSGKGKTNAAGEYKIERLGSGPYVIYPDLQRLQKDWTTKSYEDLYLREGSELDGLDFRLQRGNLVTGRVVTQENDRPLKAVGLNLVGPSRPRGSSRPYMVTTGNDGSFSFRVPDGAYYAFVLFTAAGQQDPNRFMQNFTVDSQHPIQLEFRLPRSMQFAPAKKLSGIVTDSNGVPVADAEVVCVSNGGRQFLITTNADKLGRFVFERDVDAGSYIRARKSGMATATADVFLDQKNLTLKLTNPTGRVSGFVKDEEGAPLTSASAQLVLWGERIGSSVAEQKTGPDGKYIFDGLFTDAGYSVMAKAPGFGDKYSDRISLTPGKETGVGELKLKHADATLDGTVIDPNGKPVPGVTINGVDTPSQPHTMTDENGVFHLTNLNRGDVHVQVYSNKWFYSSENKFHGGDKNVTLKLIARQEAPAGAVNEPFENMAGKKAAELKASEWINGGPFNLNTLKGKIVVIDFWATWCGPCLAALPEMEKLHNAYRDKGVIVLGMHSCDRTRVEVEALLKKRGITYPVAIDANDGGAGATMSKYDVQGIPTIAVISPQGKIVLLTHEVSEASDAVAKLLAAIR